MWDVHTHRCLATLAGHSGAVRALAATDSIVFSGSDDTTIRVRAMQGWCVEQGAGWHALGAGTWAHGWRCWSVFGPALIGHSAHARLRLLFGPNLMLLVCAFRLPHPLQAWDANTLTCLRTLEGHEDNVRVLAVGHNCLFSGSWDKTVRVRLGQRAERQLLQGVA